MNHRFTQPIELLQPRAEALPSGGNIYNCRLVEAAQARHIEISLRLVGTADVNMHFREDSTRFRIWDSLFIEALAMHDLEVARGWGLLLHYLPSLDPTLDEPGRRRLSMLETQVLNAAPLVIVTGEALLAPVRGYRRSGAVCICEPGVSDAFLDSRQQRPRRTDRVIEVLTVANMLPAKGMLELLSALSSLRELPWRWHFVGADTVDAEYTGRFSDMAIRLGVDAQILRHGPLEQSALAQLMTDIDFFVFASRFEAYGMALAEAAAAGLPAVTTDVGAARRIYRHGETGFVTAVEDTDGFTGHVRHLMMDADLRRRFRANLRACTPRTWQDTLGDFMNAMSGSNERHSVR